MTPTTGPKETVYQNQYQQIYRISAQFVDHAKVFFVNDYGRRVGVVIAKGDDVLLVRQYRFLINEIAWEIPGGKVDPEESPEAAALRETREEACLQCRKLQPLLYFHPGLDTFDNPTFMFLTEDFEEIPPDLAHQHEVSERVWVNLEQSIKMIYGGKIMDSLTVAALFAWYTRRKHPELMTL
jgi:8-oxo-dGTP pyrophosphatase MutT (NUDIX family)